MNVYTKGFREMNIEIYMELLEKAYLDQKDEIQALRNDLQGRMMKPINDRQGASINPIEVNADNLRTPESRMAAATIMHTSNRTMDFLTKEHG